MTLDKLPTDDQSYDQLQQEQHKECLLALLLMFGLLDRFQDALEVKLTRYYKEHAINGRIPLSLVGRSRAFSALANDIKDLFQETLHQKLDKQMIKMLSSVIGIQQKFFKQKLDVKKLLLLSWGIPKANWKQRLNRDVSLWYNRIVLQIKRELTRKSKLPKVLSVVHKRVKTTKKALTTLAVSETNAMSSLARLEQFKKLGVKRYRFYTRADERTCEWCKPLHGRVFTIAQYQVGVTASPIHPRCRCFQVPLRD